MVGSVDTGSDIERVRFVHMQRCDHTGDTLCDVFPDYMANRCDGNV